MRRLPAGKAQCYSFSGESEQRNAGTVCGGDFVTGVDLCVQLLGDLRELFGCRSRCGDREPRVRACCKRRTSGHTATGACQTGLFRASPFRFRCYTDRRAFAGSVERDWPCDAVVSRRGSRGSCECGCVVFLGFSSSARCGDFSAAKQFHSSHLSSSFLALPALLC
jgi:hypothetical protein